MAGDLVSTAWRCAPGIRPLTMGTVGMMKMTKTVEGVHRESTSTEKTETGKKSITVFPSS